MATTPSTPIETPAAAQGATTPTQTPASTPTPQTQAPTTPTTPVTTPQSATPEPVVAPAGDFSDILGDDLKPIAAEAPAPIATDLATKYKDDPAVQSLITEHAQYKPIAEAIKGNRYEIPTPEELKLQLEDSNALYDIMNGKKSAADLIKIMMANPAWSQESKNKAIADLSAFISEVTGKPIAAAAAGQIEDPAMAEIKKIRAEQAAEKAAKEQEVFVSRVNTAKTTLTAKVNELLKDTWLDGEGDYIYNQLGTKLGGPEKALEIVAAAERGDFTQIQKALQQVKNEEAIRFKARSDRMIAMKKKKADTIPAQVAGGSPTAPAQEPEAVVELDANKRRQKMLESFRSGQ